MADGYDWRSDPEVVKYIDCLEVSQSLFEKIKNTTELGQFCSEYGSLKIVVVPELREDQYRVVMNFRR